MSYSQYDEEKYILQATSSISIGRFLDIGAWNPTVFSNTRALYEKGWGGIMIEPSPGPMTGLIREYGNSDRVQLIMAAVMKENGFIRMHVSDDAVSTTSETHFAKWNGAAGYNGVVYLHAMSIFTIAKIFGTDFDFVNVDVEGYSAQLLLDILCYTTLRPKCFVVEHDDRGQDIMAAAQPLGYACPYENGTNMVLAK
jgi:FkbM family methyltransferase